MGKIYRSRAPLRLGLAGGGTDVSPYCDRYGGHVLNATISLFAYVDIEKTGDGHITFESKDFETMERYALGEEIRPEGQLNLLKGVYLRICKDYPFETKGLKVTSYVQAPPGSGLGSSSTLVVALIGAFAEMLQLPLGEYDIASYAFDIERIDLGMAGGRQDQYAATFGGFNFMEFYGDNKTIVNPLRIKPAYIYELERNIVLFYTSRSRESSRIISEQMTNVITGQQKSIDAMHHIREQATMMKEALLKGELHRIGDIFEFGHVHKRQMASNISNDHLETIATAARSAGATGAKISGAGGGGFMIFYCPGNSRYDVLKALSAFEGKTMPFLFTDNGLVQWRAGTKTLG